MCLRVRLHRKLQSSTFYCRRSTNPHPPDRARKRICSIFHVRTFTGEAGKNGTQTQSPGRTNQRSSFFTGSKLAVAGFVTTTCGLYVFRNYTASRLGPGSANSADRTKNTDHSKVRIQLQSMDRLAEQWGERLRRDFRVEMEGEEYQALLQERAEGLRSAAEQVAEEGRTLTAKVFTELWRTDLYPRIPRFEEWYFRYSTTYTLMALALSSACKHSVSTAARTVTGLGSEEVDAASTPVSAGIEKDLESYIRKQYELLVLRPEVVDVKLRRAVQDEIFRQVEEELREKFSVVEEIFFRKLVLLQQAQEQAAGGGASSDTTAASTQMLLPSTASTASPGGDKSATTTRSAAAGAASCDVVLDWQAQTGKIREIPAAFEKSPVRTVGIVTAGALLGKVALGKAIGTGTAVVLKSGLTTTVLSKTFFGKLAAPFLTKVLSAGGSVGAGGIVATVAGGPVGVFAGVTVDYLLHKGVALLSKKQFAEDMKEILDATRDEWIYLVSSEIQNSASLCVETCSIKNKIEESTAATFPQRK
ncbi:unnamed protein product, partial [Amoebophrya sp. A120]|eukprot:GSA120T00002132001.1